MSATWGAFSHQGHIAWAFSALFIASLAALAVGASGFFQDGCFACAPVGPAACVGVSRSCSEMVALGAVFATLLTGLCLLFALHASGAFRQKRGRPLASLLTRAGRSRTILFQIFGLTLLSEGLELAVTGIATPIQLFSFHGGCEGCPVTWGYSLWGIASYLVAFGAGAAVFGSVLTAFGFGPTYRDPDPPAESRSHR